MREPPNVAAIDRTGFSSARPGWRSLLVCAGISLLFHLALIGDILHANNVIITHAPVKGLAIEARLVAPLPASDAARPAVPVIDDVSTPVPLRERASLTETLPSANAHTEGHSELAEPVTRRAEFLSPPDLGRLRTIPLFTEGKLRLRISVSALGAIENVALVTSDPIPNELFEAIVGEIRSKPMRPALNADNRPVASSVNIVIDFAPTPLIANNRPPAANKIPDEIPTPTR